MASAEITRQDLKELIVSSLQLEDMSPDDMSDDEPLFGGQLELDSVDALELVVAIEGRYGVKIKSDEVKTEDFRSLDTLYSMIRSRQSQGVAGR